MNRLLPRSTAATQKGERGERGMKLVILDRDGTINEDRDDYVKSADEWVPIPGALEAIARLNHGGWHVVVATNQSGLGRGLFDMAALNAMHLKMNSLLAKVGGRVDAVFFCPHTRDEGCDCRKPLPGLVEQIGQRYGVRLDQVPIVGDSLRDLQAGVAVGCEPHLVRSGKVARMSEAELAALLAQVPGARVHDDLAGFVECLAQREAVAGAQAGGSRLSG
jgi:D-glycero-D-manno-heptose 1,7-bisphosphate phosphatase